MHLNCTDLILIYPAKNYYRLTNTEEVLWTQLSTMIDVEIENTFKNHIKYIFNRNWWMIGGKIENRNAVFWRMGGQSSATSLSIPFLIHTCNMVQVGEERLLKITTKLSVFAKCPLLIFGVLMWYVMINGIIQFGINTWGSIVIRVIICLILYLMMHAVPLAIYWAGNKDMNLDLIDYLDLQKVYIKKVKK